MEGYLSKKNDIILSQFVDCKNIVNEDCDLYDVDLSLIHI